MVLGSFSTTHHGIFSGVLAIPDFGGSFESAGLKTDA